MEGVKGEKMIGVYFLLRTTIELVKYSKPVGAAFLTRRVDFFLDGFIFLIFANSFSRIN